MSMSKDDLRLLRWIGGVAAVMGEDACVPVLRKLVKKQDAPGALTENHARIFTLLTASDECRDLIFRYLNLIRIRAGRSPLDESADPVLVESFMKAVKLLQQSGSPADALVQASNLYAFLQGESPALAEDAFDKLLTQEPATALTLFRTRNSAPADRLSLIKLAASGNRMAILRLADTAVVPEKVPPNMAELQKREAELQRREQALNVRIRTLGNRFGLDPRTLMPDDLTEANVAVGQGQVSSQAEEHSEHQTDHGEGDHPGEGHDMPETASQRAGQFFQAADGEGHESDDTGESPTASDAGNHEV
jgi:hypothetical protein